MKKLLLSLALSLGLGANAQIAYNGDFEAGYSTAIYGQFGGGTRTTAAACTGTYGGQLLLNSTTTSTGFMVQTLPLSQTSNGQAVTVSASYKKAANIVGTISLAYFIKGADGLWTINLIGSPASLTSAAITTCNTLTATIPTGALQPDAEIGIGVWVTRTSSSGNIYVDDINFSQDTSVTTAPGCTTFTAPLEGATISGGTVKFSWAAAPTAINYKLKVGTTPGGSDVYNATVAGLSANITLPVSSTLYATVIPSNSNGDATGCSEISFTTDASVAYCGPLISEDPANTYPISSVNFGSQGANTSAATVGAPAYEDFTAVTYNAIAGSTYQLNVTGTGLGSNRFGMTVFIDWNNDGDFNDANEQYFVNPANFVGASGSSTLNLTGNITVPADATNGNKRMRIKYNFSSSTTSLHSALANACSNLVNGQAEDYTLIVSQPTVAPGCTTILTPADNAVNVTPNPTVITWAPAEGASGYKVYIGTTPGGTDVVNGTVVVGASYSAALAASTDYYVKVIPFNSLGDASGCTEIKFTTGILAYCTATATSTTQTFERIARVRFANIDNVSNITAASKSAGYEDFTSITGIVNRGQTLPITVDIDNFDNDQVAVWIDFNKDGIFSESEKTVLTAAAVSTGNVTVPIDAKLGNTRMRVRINYNAAPPACGNTTYGQVEDYTIQIDDVLAVSSNGKAKLSVYPNPFQDVLKISDVKGVKSVSVSDVSGRQIKTLKAAAELALGDLKTGLYIVTLHMEDGTVQSFKAIKK